MNYSTTASLGSSAWCGLRIAMLVVGVCLFAGPAPGFEVIRNVNDPQPPQPRLTLFEAGKINRLVIPEQPPEASVDIGDDGLLHVRITGPGQTFAPIAWTDGNGAPGQVDLEDFGGLVITCRTEGSMTRRNRKGEPETHELPEQGGISLVVSDTQGALLWAGSLSQHAANEKNPSKMTPLYVYFSMLSQNPKADPSQISRILFRLPPRAGQNRDYRIIVSKIALF